jgi:hypothetical protein
MTRIYDDTVAALLAAGAPDPSSFDVVSLFLPPTNVAFEGAAVVGGRQQWINNSVSSRLFVHEFGHNFGLYHANFWQTGGGSSTGWGGSEEYGDPFDTMGKGEFPAGHFSHAAKAALGWIGATSMIDVRASATHRLYRFDDRSATGPTLALRVDKCADGVFWLGYRRNFPTTLGTGVSVVWDHPEGHLNLVDTTPATPNLDSAVLTGRSWRDDQGCVEIEALGSGGTAPNEWIDVRLFAKPVVTFDAPVVTPTDSEPGEPIELSVLVRNSGFEDEVVVRYHRSLDPDILPEDEVVAEQVVFLPRGATALATGLAAVPFQSGVYYGVCIDANPGRDRPTC